MKLTYAETDPSYISSVVPIDFEVRVGRSLQERGKHGEGRGGSEAPHERSPPRLGQAELEQWETSGVEEHDHAPPGHCEVDL